VSAAPRSGHFSGAEWFLHENGCFGDGSWTYSITSSARAISIGGIVTPSALAVFRLITSSNLVGCSTGKSSGFAPWRILCTSAALRRKMSGVCAP